MSRYGRCRRCRDPARRPIHFGAPVRAPTKKMQRLAAFVGSTNAKICFRACKQPFVAAPISITAKCQRYEEILPESLALVSRRHRYSSPLIGMGPFDQIQLTRLTDCLR